MEKKIDEIREHIYEIKLDLREHMSRTEVAEEKLSTLKTELMPIRKAYIGAKWSISSLITLGALVTALIKLGIIGGV